MKSYTPKCAIVNYSFSTVYDNKKVEYMDFHNRMTADPKSPVLFFLDLLFKYLFKRHSALKYLRNETSKN
jgi:hypothetical protein